MPTNEPSFRPFDYTRTIELDDIIIDDDPPYQMEPPYDDCTCSECEMARELDREHRMRDDNPRDVTQPEDKTLTYEVTVQGRHKLAPKYRRTYTVEIRLPSDFDVSNSRMDREAESRAMNYAEQDGFATRPSGRRREADPYRFKIIKTVLVSERIPMTTAC